MTGNIVEKRRSTPSVKQATVNRKPAPARVVAMLNVEKKDKKKKMARDKVKVIRDFSMPQAEYEKLVELKQICIKAGMSVKKNELLRIGLYALGSLSAPKLKQTLLQVLQIRADRPRKRKSKKTLNKPARPALVEGLVR